MKFLQWAAESGLVLGASLLCIGLSLVFYDANRQSKKEKGSKRWGK